MVIDLRSTYLDHYYYDYYWIGMIHVARVQGTEGSVV